ncbi:MAG: 4Fe-4S binding protein [Prochloraceae cyanobacterium]
MISKVSERTIHYFRWVLAIGWLILIASLFYDPISHLLTDPNNSLSPFRDFVISRAQDPATCVRVQGECLPSPPYPLETIIFWKIAIPIAIPIVFIFGHETWRRICPLYFFSQITRALGLKPRLDIYKNHWLTQNYLYLQFTLLFIGLSLRLLFINSVRPVLGLFLLLTIISAIAIVFLYGGRSWCHYVCPFGVVQTFFTGPRGLLGSEAHKAPPASITQSACRTVDQMTGEEISTCTNCNNPCFDIDAEKSYWEQLQQPGRRFVQYGYLGLIIGYLLYYYLYSGNFDYYFSGIWAHEPNQLETLLKPGFYLFDRAINIPKLVAVPLTLALFVGISYWIGTKIEKASLSYMRRHNSDISRELVLHRVFSIFTFVAFNILYIYASGSKNSLVQLIFGGFVVLLSTLWIYRTWNRSSDQYLRETVAEKLRRQLQKLSTKLSLNLSQFLENRPLEQLKPDELYILAKVLPGVTRQNLEQIYAEVLQEALEEEYFEPAASKEALKHLRQKQDLTDEEHDRILAEVLGNNPQLMGLSTQKRSHPQADAPKYIQGRSLAISQQDPTVLRAISDQDASTAINIKGQFLVPSQEDPTLLRATSEQDVAPTKLNSKEPHKATSQEAPTVLRSHSEQDTSTQVD